LVIIDVICADIVIEASGIPFWKLEMICQSLIDNPYRDRPKKMNAKRKWQETCDLLKHGRFALVFHFEGDKDVIIEARPTKY